MCSLPTKVSQTTRTDIDPEGSVSIIDLPRNIRSLKQANVRTAAFQKFNDVALDPSVRIFGPNATVAQDLEPEYITVASDSKTAWVSLQENNAIARAEHQVRQVYVHSWPGL
jgi:hypothetical protein